MDIFYSSLKKSEPCLTKLYYCPPKHKEYNSIKQFHKRNLKKDNEVVIITEKIHGSNLCITIIDDFVILYKRHGIISYFENFYNAKNVINLIRKQLLCLANELKVNSNDIIRVYGELYGGDYDNITKPGHKFVQKNMNYCPFNSYDIFTISIETEGKIYYLSWDEVKVITEKYNLHHVPELLRCTINTLSDNIDIEKLQTSIPGSHNLSNTNSNCEGVVIRLEKPPKGHLDIICKLKKKKFDETFTKKHHTGPKINLDIFLEQMNSIRFESFVSKYGKEFICKKNTGFIISEIYKDIILDLNDNDNYTNLSLNNKDKLKKKFSAKIHLFIRDYI